MHICVFNMYMFVIYADIIVNLRLEYEISHLNTFKLSFQNRQHLNYAFLHNLIFI